MKKSQVWLVLAIIALPVVIGAFSALGRHNARATDLLAKKIGLVRIEDAIDASEESVRQLKDLREDHGIAGVLLRIDSPGGAASPSQEIFEEAMRYRADNKPLVVSMGNVAASGAYYIASAGSRIFANPSTITGSIGVVFQYSQYYKLLDKIGVSIGTIKSGHYKDMGNPFRAMTGEERGAFQALLDDTHEQFIRDVGRARSFPLDSLRRIADGRVFTGRQARLAGLVDTLGGYEDALAYLRETTGLSENAKVVEKRDRFSNWREMFMSEIVRNIPLLKHLHAQTGAYFLYGGW
ncbi:MAG: signal peptide peptidase SppA [Chitinivibrionales bacterium]|nr:signal peptide peptidase SppA [Chitinivibrionales bacterium]